MTTIVYKEEMITSTNSGTPRNVQTKTFTVQIMGDGTGGGSRTVGNSSMTPRHSSRGGSPKPSKKFSVRVASKMGKHSSFTPPSVYNSHSFTITAYLPHDGGKRLRLQCSPGQSVQEVIESEIPDLSRTGYQVYQFPSRALLNPEKDASVLQDQEISIEPMRAASPDEAGDDRLAIVKELLRSEDTYLENLRNIFDIYMEPLKKYGLPQTEMNTMFRSLSRLCDLLMNFFSELEQCVKRWNMNTTLIGGLFKQYQSFWEMYMEYSISYTKACKLLKDKRTMDGSFNQFLEMKRGAAMHTLESLMLLPVQRIYEYHKLLMRLYSLTPKEHPDYHDLRYTITRVSTIVQVREQQLNHNQNELKLEQVQTRFPHHDLGLFQPLDVIEVRAMTKRSKTGQVLGGSSNRLLKSPNNWISNPMLGPSPSPQDEMDGTNSRNRVRLYLSEGPVRILSAHGLQSHARHLFLFDDLLIVSKPVKQKSQHKMFKRKVQVRLSEVWVAECQDKSIGNLLMPSTYFLIGWPFTNYLASFTTPGEKTLWFNLLKKYTTAQRLEYDKISVQLLNLTNSSNPTPTWITVTAQEQASDLLTKAIETMAIAVSEANCQLWVKISKDDAVRLVGHEYPYGIQMYHNRHRLEYSDKPSQLQFVVKRKEPTQLIVSKHHSKKSVISGLWKNKKSKTKTKNVRIFGAPLDMVIVNNELPDILQEILVQLFTEGPTARGIFRHSANYRRVKNLMDAIDHRVDVKLYDCTIHEVGALLKNLLRNVPGGILLSSRYTELVATNDCKDIQIRVQQIQKVVFRLPNENQLFLGYLMPLLYHISQAADVNGMSSINLAICFAPSLLWPSTGLDVIKNEVPPLIQFFIEHCPDIFGAELPALYKQAVLPPSPNVEKMEFNSVSPSPKQFVPTKVADGEQFCGIHKRSDSLDSSISEDFIMAETDEEHCHATAGESTLLKAKRSGITLSDSQLSHISQVEDYGSHPGNSTETSTPSSKLRLVRKRGVIETTGKHIHHIDPVAGIGGVNVGSGISVDRPSPKRVKKGRIPERSSSLHGPSDMIFHRQKNVRTNSVVPLATSIREMNDAILRRKSIATQEMLSRAEFVPEFTQIPSPSSSYNSSSHSYSPKMIQMMQQGKELYTGYPRHEDQVASYSKKVRRLPRYSHSFTSQDMEKPVRSIPASSSFYDKLLPLEAEREARGGRVGEHHSGNSSGKFVSRLEIPGSEDELHHSRPILPNSSSSFATNSTPSISSSTNAARAGPSNSSLNTGLSGPSLNGTSPDLLMQGSTVDQRFSSNGGGMDLSIPSPPTPSSASTTSTYSTQDSRVIINIHNSTPAMNDLYTPSAGSESGQDSLERIQKKLQDRKRLDSSDVPPETPSTFGSSSAYKGFLSTQRKGDSLVSLAEESSIDDRPECDLHLGSLSRQMLQSDSSATGSLGGVKVGSGAVEGLGIIGKSRNIMLEVAMDHDASRGNGYNSDTESAPSRTLSRPGKIDEVSSPTKLTLPSRYYQHHMVPQYEAKGGRKSLSCSYQKKQHHLQQARIQQQLLDSVAHSTTPAKALSATLEQSLSADLSAVDPVTVKPTITSLSLSSSSTTATTRATANQDLNATTSGVRHKPKSVDSSSRVERLTKLYKSQEDPVNGDIEHAKVKLGLIPHFSVTQRQRSKSTSDREAMRILHKLMGEETEMPPCDDPQEDEWTVKHKEWLSSAPTSAERKKAWESQTSKSQLQRKEYKSRSMRNTEVATSSGGEKSPMVATPNFTSHTSDPKRKCSTLPDVINGKQVMMVKVRTYEIPEVQRIRRINLRTYH